MDTSIFNILADAMVTALETALVTNVGDETKARFVREGLHQDDPTNKIVILVHPARKNWPHMLYVPIQQGGVRYAQSYEVGGGISVINRRHFVVEVRCFYGPGVSRDDAITRSNVVLERAEDTLWTMAAPTDVSSFGEHAQQTRQIYRSFIEEGGGEGAHNWQGEIAVEWLTDKERAP